MRVRYLVWLVAVTGLAFFVERLHFATQPSFANAVRTQGAEDEAGILFGQDVRLIDLTHDFDERTIYWPTEVPFHLDRGFAGVTEGGWYYASNRFSMAEHSGTHVDAPCISSKAGSQSTRFR